MSYVNLTKLANKREKRTLYHGSPYKLDVLKPMQAGDKFKSKTKAGSRSAVYLSSNPDEAYLYAIMRPRGKKRSSFFLDGTRVHYLGGTPLNKQGYVYSVETDRYTPPPKGLDPLGYTVDHALTPTRRRRVRLRGNESRFVEYKTKAEYKRAQKPIIEKVLNRL